MLYKNIVIKFGTSTLTQGTNHLSRPHMVELVRQVAHAHSLGCEIIMVSSGAIAAGRERLNFPELPKYVPSKQMLAAVGQTFLMDVYTQLFNIFGITVAQILLTRSDFIDRTRYLNARNTINALLSHNVIPIVNENDTVAVEEICFGDNDNLSAMVANLVESDLLVLLTDQKGLYTQDPSINPEAELMTQIDSRNIADELWVSAGSSKNGLGTGGMTTKLHSADLARRAGIPVIIACGKENDVITRIICGDKIGTFFTSVSSKLESRKRYLLLGIQSSNTIVVDEGAENAIKNGSSLLPIGIKMIKGTFDRGEAVKIVSLNNQDIAIGHVNYSSPDLQNIYGHHSNDIETILGYTYGEEVIHHNNMVIL